eukprot:GHVS01103943.1.p2 GENE.GHVS01103943.1~~GHVS01103943.1.p2  ORF type:complete len:155 (+),score=12.56 GHVS01103943.1:28-465(+)
MISEDMVKQMRPGSVVLDLATEFGDRENGWGGNCQCSPLDGVVHVGAVTVIGRSRIEAHMPTQASELFSMNITNFLEELGGGAGFNINMEDDIIRAMCVTMNRKILWAPPVPTPSPRPSSVGKTEAPETKRPKHLSILEEVEKSV